MHNVQNGTCCLRSPLLAHVDIMLHLACRYGGAGAVWDIARRQDVPQLRHYLSSHKPDFQHAGQRVSEMEVGDVIFDQVMLKRRVR